MGGEPVGVCGKGLFDYQAAHFPMTRGCVFPFGPGCGLAKRSGGLADWRNWQGADITEPAFSEICNLDRSMGQNMPYGISAGVAIFGGVRHFPDAYAVQHYQDYASEATRSTHSTFSPAAGILRLA